MLGKRIVPIELATGAPLLWSPGTGTQVWNLFTATIAGDLAAITSLLDEEPALVRAQHAYVTPLYFAVRENQVAAARLLLHRGANALCFTVHNTHLDIARDRAYAEMEALLIHHLESAMNASAQGNAVATAIRAFDTAEVRRLLDAAPTLLHTGDLSSNQPIHWAVMTRQPGLIDELHARGADLNVPRASDQARPIHLTNGDYHYRGWRDVPDDTVATSEEVLAHLLKKGARLDLNTACLLGDINQVRQMLAADPTSANRVSDYIGYYAGSGAPLSNAAARGHLEIVRLLLETGADPNLNEPGIAPRGKALYEAVSHCHADIARLLLEHGAHPNAPVESSADALTIALRHKDDALADLLASYGAVPALDILAYYGDVRTAAAIFATDPHKADDPHALATAAENGQELFIKLMLRYQPDLAQRIGVAAETKELTAFLFAQGMNASHADWLGVTPLHKLARQGNLAMTALFLDHGAHIDARDEDLRSTPLAFAAHAGQRQMVEFLLARGASKILPDDEPWSTPLAWATRRGHHDIAALLG